VRPWPPLPGPARSAVSSATNLRRRALLPDRRRGGPPGTAQGVVHVAGHQDGSLGQSRVQPGQVDAGQSCQGRSTLRQVVAPASDESAPQGTGHTRCPIIVATCPADAHHEPAKAASRAASQLAPCPGCWRCAGPGVSLGTRGQARGGAIFDEGGESSPEMPSGRSGGHPMGPVTCVHQASAVAATRASTCPRHHRQMGPFDHFGRWKHGMDAGSMASATPSADTTALEESGATMMRMASPLTHRCCVQKNQPPNNSGAKRNQPQITHRRKRQNRLSIHAHQSLCVLCALCGQFLLLLWLVFRSGHGARGTRTRNPKVMAASRIT